MNLEGAKVLELGNWKGKENNEEGEVKVKEWK